MVPKLETPNCSLIPILFETMDEEEALILEIEEAFSNHTDSGDLPSISAINLLQSLLDNPQHGSATLRFISAPFVVPLLASAMDSGPPCVSIVSSKAYLSIILLSPSHISMFSPLHFLSSLSSLRRSLKRTIMGTDSEQGDRNTSKVKRKGKKNSVTTSLFRQHDVYLSVVEKLREVVSLVNLTRFPDVSKSLVQTIADIPSSAAECFSSIDYNRLTVLCSDVLFEVLCCADDDGDTAVEVFKSLTPLLLCPGKSQARRFALEFSRRLLNDNAVGRRNGVRRALVNFPRYLARKAPDKAETRKLAAEGIISIISELEATEIAGFVEFALKMTTGKGNLRILGVELVFNVVWGEVRKTLSSQIVETCVNALIERCSDANASMRARTLLCLTNLIENCLEENMFLALKDKLKKVLHLCCVDEKTNVRRAALGLIAKLISSFGKEILDVDIVEKIGMACSDPLVSTRRSAVLALSEAFRCFPEENICFEWLNSVPRLITDNESTIQEECESLFLELVLDRITTVGTSSTLCDELRFSRTSNIRKSDNGSLPDSILMILEGICHGEIAPWVKKICASLGKKKRLKPKLAHALQKIIKSSESFWLRSSTSLSDWTAPPGAWFLLSEASAFVPSSIDWEFLHHNSQLIDQTKSSRSKAKLEGEATIARDSVAWSDNRVFLMQTIANVSVQLSPESAADLAQDLLKRIQHFTMHTSEVNAHVKALKVLCKRKSSNQDEAERLVRKWVQQVLSKATRIIDKFISGNSDAARNSSFLTPSKASSQSKVETAIYTIGSIVITCPPADVSKTVPLLHNIITSGQSDSKTGKPPIPLEQYSSSLYTQSWLTMGKICIADEKLAKRYIPLFVQELEKTESAALRNNLVVMMSDFCIRHTALVDCYISKITKCLRDPCELVRRQTFILLSRLLQRDYVKWRGILFLRFLLCLVDESDKIRQLAIFLFENILKVKAPILAYNSFVEAIFVLNGFNVNKDPKAENKLFCIRGNDVDSRSKRMHIYVSLLKQMAPEHLLATFAKVSAEILAYASDGMLNLNDVVGQSVVEDAFRILSCKEIRIQSVRVSQSDDAEGDEGGEGTPAAGRAMSQGVRKGLIQNTIPIFIELKRLLESKNSPLTGSLMECLRVLLEDFKNEIDDILVADQQLRKELMYDMQKYEAAKARSAAAAAKTQGASRTEQRMKEMRNHASTPLASMSIPKLKSDRAANDAPSSRFSKVIESVRKRHYFDSDDEN